MRNGIIKQIKKTGLTSLLALTTFGMSSIAQAGGPEQRSFQSMLPVMTFTGGVAIAQMDKSTTFPFGFSTYQYVSNNATSSPFLGGVFVGAEFPGQRVAVQVGIGYYQTTQFKASGNLTQGVDPQSSDTYPYSYNMSSSQFLVESKVLTMPEKIYHPYVTAGIGESLNNVYHFHETYPIFLTFTPLYNNNTILAFTYSIGTGLDVDVGSHVRLGVGYRFTDLGRASLGMGVIDTTPIPNRLSKPDVYANEVFAQLTIR